MKISKLFLRCLTSLFIFFIAWNYSGSLNQNIWSPAAALAEDIYGTPGDDTLTGTSGDDIIFGMAGNDTINASSGNDIIDGGLGDDTMYGGNDTDTLYCGPGNDLLYGGWGNDTYIYNRNDGTDTIYDHRYTDDWHNWNGNSGYWGGTADKIIFGPGISPSDLTFYQAGPVNADGNYTDLYDLVIELHDPADPSAPVTDQITILDFSKYGNRIETLEFTDYPDDTMDRDAIALRLVSDDPDTVWWYAPVTMDGGLGDDHLQTSGWADTVYGNEGNDTIYAGGGNDTVYGGPGNDTIHSQDGNDTIEGNEGNDYISASNGNDIVDGGLGDDTMYGGNDTDTLYCGPGNDLLYGGWGNDTYIYNRNDGTDTIYDHRYTDDWHNWNGNSGYWGGTADKIIFGPGISPSDLTFYQAGPVNADGNYTDLYDLVIELHDPADPSAPVTDQITILDFSKYGNRIETLEFTDYPDDTMDRDAIALRLVSDDPDTVWWYAPVTMDGGLGDDHLQTSGWADTVYGNEGNDTIYAGGGNDTVYGGPGNDTIHSQDGNDTIEGNEGNDYISASNGNDIVDGGLGDDTMYGGNDTDTLYCGPGNDLLYGGWGNDTYIYNRNDGTDTIYDHRYTDDWHNWNGNSGYWGGTADKIIFGPGISPSDLTFYQAGPVNADGNYTDLYDLVIELHDPADPSAPVTDQITILDFSKYGNRIETLEFTDYPDDTMDRDAIALRLVSDDPDTVWWYAPVTMDGGLGDDYLQTSGWADTVYGNEGNDTIYAGGGNDTVYGGPGNDTIHSQDGNDTIEGNEGNDYISASNGNDIVDGGLGDDTMYGGNDTDTLYCGPGNDLLYGGWGNDTYIYNRNDGTDTIYDHRYTDDWHNWNGNSGYWGGTADKIIFGPGISPSDLTFYQAGPVNADGNYTDLYDLVIELHDPADPSAPVTDQITILDFSKYGNRIETLEFTDYPDDTMDRDAIALRLVSDDPDTVWWYAPVTMDGGLGDDHLQTSGWADTVYGNEGNDTIYAGGGNDTVYGGPGNDTIHSQDGNDTIEGNEGNDYISASNGNDIVDGGLGDDTMYGGNDTDTLYCGPGNDLLYGGWGNDTYIYNRNDGTDTIYDHRYTDDWHNWNGNSGYWGGTADKIIFGPGISPSDLTFYQAGPVNADGNYTDLYDLVIELHDPADPSAPVTDQITILDFSKYGNRIETLEFTDYPDDTMDRDAIALRLVSDDPDTVWWYAPVTMDGGLGDDYLQTSGWADTVYGNEGNDTIYAGGGNDTVYGGPGNDTIHSQDGNDTIEGNEGNDYISASNGNDIVDGGLGDDTMYGGNDTDTLYCGPGNDLLYGGWGNDTYIYNRNDGTDTIYDHRYTDDWHNWNGNSGYWGGTADKIVFGPGISLQDLAIWEDGYHLIIGVRNPDNPGIPPENLTDRITITDHAKPGNRIEFLQFSNGSRTDLNAIGPSMTDILFNGAPVEDDQNIHNSGDITLNIWDEDGIDRVEFYWDGSLVHTDSSGAESASWYLDIDPLPDGNYTLKIIAYDINGYITTAEYSVWVAVVVPNPPEFTSPAHNEIVPAAPITLTGTAEPASEMYLYLNGALAVDPFIVAGNGSFSVELTLIEGDNIVMAMAENRAGMSDPSPDHIIILHTLLDNPADLSSTSTPESIALDWSGVEPANLLDHYNIYQSTTSFTNVDSMSPVFATTETTAEITGLLPEENYFFGVTAVNIYGDERSEVNSGFDSLVDVYGPSITNVKVGSVALADGHTFTGPATITLNATDKAGVSRVEFASDSVVKHTDFSGQPTFSFYWDVILETDGQYTLAITAYDSLGNATTNEYLVNIGLNPPGKPVITSPVNGIITSNDLVTVTGTAEVETQVHLYNNGNDTGVETTANPDGSFSMVYNLAEGVNSLQVAASNRAGLGALSNAKEITLDSTIPQSPINLSATAKAGGEVRLAWQNPAGSPIIGVDIYRSDTSFAMSGQADKINSNPISGTYYYDLPPGDAIYYYRAIAVNSAGTSSELSSEASVSVDSQMPRANITYEPQGVYDPDTGRTGPGLVKITLEVNEPLLTTPFLGITPAEGQPEIIDLRKRSDLIFTGQIVIDNATPTGTAYAVFSARDLANNRGTDLDSGATLEIDTDGPAVIGLEVSPGKVIINDSANPATVIATIGLNETMPEGVAPELSYLLSGLGREPIIIDSLLEIDTQEGHVQTWQATFTLPADAGLAEAETFQFFFSASDDLGNVSDDIRPDNLFQVYQGGIAPLDPPTGLKAKALAAGKIKLTWNAVEEAVGYQLYRQAPAEQELLAYGEPLLGDITEFEDAPATDGVYTYAVASIRQEYDYEAVSGLSNLVNGLSDSVPPEPPTGMTLKLAANGMVAEWQAPPYTDGLEYKLYRADAAEITSVEGMEPLFPTTIPQTLVVDPHPSATQHCYTVTAVDSVGNESAPAPSAYFNPDLLPVAGLKISLVEGTPLLLTWTPPNKAVSGYNVYLGEEGSEKKLNYSPVTIPLYMDYGFTQGATRRYTVKSVDSYGGESLGRFISMPAIQAVPAESNRIMRGVMNRLDYTVENKSNFAVDNVRMQVQIYGHDHYSDEFSLAPYESRPISLTVGGYDDLPDHTILATVIDVRPQYGEEINIVRNDDLQVGQGMLVLGINNEEFVRGVTGSASFTLENTGDEAIDIITATNSQQQASNEINFSLQDIDGNVLASKPFKQITGQYLVTLSNGVTVARIPAGETFVSDPVTLNIPGSAPDDVKLKVAIKNIRFNTNRDNQVTLKGLATSLPLALIDTSYYGEITSITPQSSEGDEDIIITGQALDRSSGQPLPYVELELTISANGFNRLYGVTTDETGSFSHTFTPMQGEAGIYKVRVVHPDLLDRPVQGSFIITRMLYRPSVINVTIPRNYSKTSSVKVTTGAGTTLNDLSLSYNEADQPGGAFAEGVHLTLGNPVSQLGPGKSASLSFSIWADNSAPDVSRHIFRVTSAEKPDTGWGTVTVDLNISEVEAIPVLQFKPSYIETGLSFDDTVTESVTLSNNGLADMTDVKLALKNLDGTSAPSWLYLISPDDLGTLSVGETQLVSVNFSPKQGDINEGIHTYYLEVTSTNHPTAQIYLTATVTQSGIGDVFFKVIDIYTGTNDTDGNKIEGVKSARIKVQNETITNIEHTVSTDSYGEVFIYDLTPGSYRYRITAANHEEETGRFWIKPGLTESQDVFLDYNLVTVEWSVREITIEDKYELVLTAVYETDVPAAVVVAKPGSVTLPDLQEGDIFQGEFTLSNTGLVRADNLDFILPADDEFFRYELMAGLPDSLDARSSVVVPYRVITLKTPTQEDDGAATGGGCWKATRCVIGEYNYDCAEEITTEDSTSFCFIYDWGTCGGSPAPVTTNDINPPRFHFGGEGLSYIAGTPVSPRPSTSNPPRPQSTPLEEDNDECAPDRRYRYCQISDTDSCSGSGSSSDCQSCNPQVGSEIETFFGKYLDVVSDLSVKVAGGTYDAYRMFYDDKWHLGKEVGLVTREGRITTVEGRGIVNNSSFHIEGYYLLAKDGVIYRRPFISTDENPDFDPYPLGSVFKRDYADDHSYIKRVAGGYEWVSKDGRWSTHDIEGRILESGDRHGAILSYIYESERLVGVNSGGTQVAWYDYDTEGNLISVRDAEGRQANYYYQGELLSRVEDVRGHATIYQYSGDLLVSKQGPGDRRLDLSYNGKDLVSRVTNQDGDSKTFEYDYNKSGDVFYAMVRHASGLTEEFWFNYYGKVIKRAVNGVIVEEVIEDYDQRSNIIYSRNGYATQQYFDERSNLIRQIRPDGTTIRREYDFTLSKPVLEVDTRGIETLYEYDAFGSLVRKTEASGTIDERVTEYTHDDRGNVLTVKVLADTNTPESLTVMTYDAFGNMTSITDPAGNETTFTHDIMGNVLTRTDGRSKVWTYTYDVAGNLLTMEDPLGNVTENIYDEAGNLVKRVDPQLHETTYTYGLNNNLIAVTDHNGNITNMIYDTEDRLVKQIDAEGNSIRYMYDAEGRLYKAIDGNGNETAISYEGADSDCSSCPGAGPGNGEQPTNIIFPTFEKKLGYDELGRKVAEKDVLSISQEYLTTYQYDAAGNLVSKTDKENNTTSYEYDSLNRLVRVIDPQLGETTYTYDDRDNLLSLIDAEGNETQFAYDSANRLIRETRPLGQVTTYDYDGAGNLKEKIDHKGQKIEYGYDDANRLTGTSYYAATDLVTPKKTVSFTYDDASNLTGYSDGTTSSTYTYDDLNRKTGETVNYGAFSLGQSYTYHANGLKATYTGPDNVTYSYTYDANNQLSGVDIPGQGMISYNSYTWTRPDAVTLPGGSRKEYTYDPLMRVKDIIGKDRVDQTNQSYQYTYDSMDNITTKTTEHGSYGYTYDDLYRLTDSEFGGLNSNSVPDESYTYDDVGNRLTSTDFTDWTYNDNNELQGFGEVSYQYDDNGNVISKTIDVGGLNSNSVPIILNFIYNEENRLIKVETDQSVVIAEYNYDPFGRRLWKDVSGVKTYYLYSDEGLVGEYDGSGNEIRTYGWQPNSIWSTDPLFMKQNGSYYYYRNDHLGTPMQMTDADGLVVWEARYDAFGKAVDIWGQNVNSVPDITNNLRFPGQYYDSETGLHYNWNRYYSPETGRYLRVDPIGFLGGDENLYAYVWGNPIFWSDPWGLESFADGGGWSGLNAPKDNKFMQCMSNCMLWGEKIPIISGPVPQKIAIHEGIHLLDHKTSNALGRLYYTYIKRDGRFKARGKSSKVLVPRAARKASSAFRFGGYLFWYKFAYKTSMCFNECNNPDGVCPINIEETDFVGS